MSVVEETPLDVAGQDVVLVRERCTNCEWEAISAPSILRSDHDLLPAFEPGMIPESYSLDPAVDNDADRTVHMPLGT